MIDCVGEVESYRISGEYWTLIHPAASLAAQQQDGTLRSARGCLASFDAATPLCNVLLTGMMAGKTEAVFASPPPPPLQPHHHHQHHNASKEDDEEGEGSSSSSSLSMSYLERHHSLDEHVVHIPTDLGKSLSSDAACCFGFIDTEDTALADDGIHISRRLGCLGRSKTFRSSVNAMDIEMARIQTEKSPCALLFIFWFPFGCLGLHRLIAGRRKSAAILALCFVITLAFTIISWVEFFSPGKPTAWLVIGIIASVCLAAVLGFWLTDLVRLRQWTQYVFLCL